MTSNSYLKAHRAAAFAPCIAILSLILSCGVPLAASSDSQQPATAKEAAMITLLQSTAPQAEKAITCKHLAIYGTKDAVPALAPLLADPELASWARIALEAIPDPACDAALRGALDKVQGRLLVGVINSIAVRRDPKAARDLVKKLKDSDPDVVSAAAVALGRIGGTTAAKALTRSLSTAPEPARSDVARGCILCAEWFVAQGKQSDAAKLYDTVRAAKVPRQRQFEAIRGAILARQAAGLPLLLEQLRSPDKALYGIGLRAARELPGTKVTEALAAELRQCAPERQSFLLLALADRTDAAVMPAVLAAAGNGPQPLRLTAIGALDRLGNPSSVPVLLTAAADPDADVAQAALSALARMPGNEVDAAVPDRLATASGKNRQVLITLAGQRHIDRALPAILTSAGDSDPAVRGAAIQAIGILGTDAQAADLVRLLQATQNAKERGDIEMALLAISGRTGARSVPSVLPLARNDDIALRIIALHVLGSAGGPDALAAVQSAIQDKDETVQDEAVRTLSTWPNNWPEDSSVAQPLLTLAKSDAKLSHQVLALRGYLQYLHSDKQLKNDDKLAKVNDVLPLTKRPEEKRLAIAAIGTIPTPAALEMLVTYAEEPAVSEDACSAIVKLAASPIPAVTQDQRKKALQLAIDKSTSNPTKREARRLLRASE